VVSDNYSSVEREEEGGETNDLTDEIGRAAVDAVLTFEESQGRSPQEMPHFNPGYDVVSSGPDGRRLIEVKGIDGEWNGVGVKLSRAQFRFAQDHPEEFWLYVIEHALEPQKRQVRPLQNPFPRVDGYLFDQEWRQACEPAVKTRDLLIRVGATVEDPRFGRGVIDSIGGHGFSQQARVRFRDWGLKLIPLGKINVVD
jgi:hypothetical protein